MKNIAALVVFSSLLATFTSCEKKGEIKAQQEDSLSLRYSILSRLPHNDKAFTEGLVFYGDKLLESTGMNNQSWIAEADQSSGDHDKKVILDSRYFGEGITVLNKKIYHLTYEEKTGFIYSVDTYEKVGEFTYNTQGWGLTHNNVNLIMSDGSDKLYFLDTTTLKTVRTLPVTDGNMKVKNLNELEFVNNYIFANVYETSNIVKIDPSNGKVVGRLDLAALTNEIKSTSTNTDVLNGIAYDKKADALLVTGKYWPKSFLIRIH